MNDMSSPAKPIDKTVEVGILGTGVMGVQIGTVMLRSGYKVVLKTRSEERKGKAREQIAAALCRNLPEEEAVAFLDNLRLTTDFGELRDCGIIIEAVKEDLDIKMGNLKALSETIKDGAMVFSNSSSMSMDELSKCLPRRENFLGFHVFNPFEKMRLVEIVVTSFTSPATIAAAFELAGSLGKTPVLVKDSPGYIVNRLLFLQMNEAIRLLERGVSTKEDIDSAIKLGLNHPLGPFELADLIGLDICLSILRILERDLGNPSYRPGKTLEGLVAQGHLGRKSGKGFYNHPRK